MPPRLNKDRAKTRTPMTSASQSSVRFPLVTACLAELIATSDIDLSSRATRRAASANDAPSKSCREKVAISQNFFVRCDEGTVLLSAGPTVANPAWDHSPWAPWLHARRPAAAQDGPSRRRLRRPGQETNISSCPLPPACSGGASAY